MTDEQLFYESFGKNTIDLSNEYWPQIFRNVERHLNRRLDQYTNNRNVPKPILRFLNDPEMNCMAAKMQNKYLIGYNLGVVPILFNIFNRMLSFTEVFPEFSPKGIREQGTKIKDPFVTNCLRIEGFDFPFSSSSIKRNLSYQLMVFALDFLLFHEIGHIVNGHIDYVDILRERDVPRGNQPKRKLSGLDRQTLEMDADAFAVNKCMSEILYRLRNIDALHSDNRIFFKNIAETLSMWSFSVYSLFRMFGLEYRDVDQLEIYNYLPVAIRSFQAIFTADKFIEQIHPAIHQPVFKNALGQGCGNAELAFETISMNPIDKESLMLILEDRVERHTTKVLYNWNNVRPNIEHLAFEPLADYRR